MKRKIHIISAVAQLTWKIRYILAG